MAFVSLLTLVSFLLFPCADNQSEGHKSSSLLTPASVNSFIFVSQIGGMVGGATFCSVSSYLGADGTLQSSREESNGILHSLKTGRADINPVQQKIESSTEAWKRAEAPGETNREAEVSEYYSPKILLNFLLPADPGYFSHYFELSDTTNRLSEVLKSIDTLFSDTPLSKAKDGLYARAQRIPNAKNKFIKAAANLNKLGPPARETMCAVISREMALVRIGGLGDEIILLDGVSLKPNRPLYLEADNLVYLITTYRLEGEARD